MRGRMAGEISKLSVVWKRERAEREEAKKGEARPTEIVASSDDEVDIVEMTPAMDKGKGKGKSKSKNSPVRKNPARMRLG
jgi:hypothetical protein